MFKVGEKVVPLQKTVPTWGDLSSSMHWQTAQENNQGYLFVTGYKEDQSSVLILNEIESELNSGDYFYQEDVIRYEPIEWHIRYYNDEKVRKIGYSEKIEWIEVHDSEDGIVKLLKYKKDDIDSNGGYVYKVIVEDEEILDWVEKNIHDFSYIQRKNTGYYVSDYLDIMMEFIEEVKKKK